MAIILIGVLLFTQELAHSGLPSSTFVQSDASVLGATPWEARALSPEHVHELLLRQVAHLLQVDDLDHYISSNETL